MKLIEKLLVANRGEIAVRIIRSARRLGIPTVAVYAADEAGALHVRMADEAYGLGGGELKDTYLDREKIIRIARLSACDAIHPGYGFLSENPAFAQACEEAGITFVGPNARAIRQMGNKVESRALAIQAGLPVTLGLTGSTDEILARAASLPFPVLVKAAAGGGGKGMRIAERPGQLKEALEATAREAAAYFGDGTVFVEQYITRPRHIEIQVLGDKHGNMVHLFERECSIQRRYQKIVEESPSPTLTPEVREQMGAAAVSIAASIGYDNAGTVEFLVDESLNFYFLEMNTRIQVEHPVTEMVTGTDLVAEQILVASGYPLRLRQEDLRQEGHAIECRIYAEDPEHHFLPSPGEITLYRGPSGKDIRTDSSLEGPGPIRPQYDPMIAKLIVRGGDRELTRRRMIQALNAFVIQGIRHNIRYLGGILEHEAYIENTISTGFCAENTEAILEGLKEKQGRIPKEIPAIAFLLHSLAEKAGGNGSVWSRIGFWRLITETGIRVGDEALTLTITGRYGDHYHLLAGGRPCQATLLGDENGRVEFILDGAHHLAWVSATGPGQYEVTCQGFPFRCTREDFLGDVESFAQEVSGTGGQVLSMMPGKVVKINVENGQTVSRGEVLLIVEAMKMENNILAPHDGTVSHLTLRPGDKVDASTELLVITPGEKETETT